MPTPSIYISGQDVEALGLRVKSIKGPWDIPAQTDSTVVLPGRAGALRTGAPTQIAARNITIEAIIRESSSSRSHADLLAKTDVLRALFGAGLLELRLADQLPRGFVARLTSFDVTMSAPTFLATDADVTITLVCTDPFAFDLLPMCVGFFGSPRVLQLGTAPSVPLIRIMGPATNPVITYRNLSGDVVHTIGLTRALIATDYEEIDLSTLKITRYQSGVASNDAPALSSGDYESFVLSPEDGDALAGPTLECSGLTGDGNCEVVYTRLWL